MENSAKKTFLIGEACVGKGDEIAHVEVIIGDKDGPVGKAFSEAFANPKMGHTPLLAVIRPNLPAKPWTLIVPKVTIKNLDQANIVFGPVQAAVAKAVADAVEDGIIPIEKIDDWVIIASVFVSPKAKDIRKLYNYNYSATKLAIRRALMNYPSIDKLMYDKDRAVHPHIGFRIANRLWRPPYLQIALDIPNINKTLEIVKQLPKSDRIILEAGTPLIKRYGAQVIRQIRSVASDAFIVADLKTLDVSKVEVDIAYEETADGVIASGLADSDSLNKFIYEARRLGIYAFVDMMYVNDPVAKLETLDELPDVVILHRAIDVETKEDLRWGWIREIKEKFKGHKILIAVAGGIVPEKVPEALAMGADILIVGRYITQSRDVERSTREFLFQLATQVPKEPGDIDLFRVHSEDL
ncbi:MAG: bifunctional 5,6,7,8-tetrahydromethanopterin hydro-lyase/3-hexulose-6-phosphate synthase [Candidatus Baldrarchaeia archaeon]